MEDSVDMIVLTKSKKHGDYCVAGIDIATGNWIRIVSDNDIKNGALPEEDMQYEDGSYCEPLDVVQVPILYACPTAYQPENVLIDNEYYIEKKYRISIFELMTLFTTEKKCVILDDSKPYVTKYEMGNIGRSLFMVTVSDFQIVHPKYRSTKASFIYNDTMYENISVTDPKFYHVQNGRVFKQAILIMSLPDGPFRDGNYYKFIAKVFVLR